MKRYVVVTSESNTVICVLNEHFKMSALLRALKEFYDDENIVMEKHSIIDQDVIYKITSLNEISTFVTLTEAHLYT
jgi:hypothetical protein